MPLHLSVPAQEKLKNSPDNPERDQIRRRSSRLSSSIGHEILNTDHITTSTAIQPLKDAGCNQKESEKGKQLLLCSGFVVLWQSSDCCKLFVFTWVTCRLCVCNEN